MACVTVEHQREQGPTKTLGYMLYIGDYTTGLVRYRDYDRKLIGIPMNQPVSWDVKRVLNGTQLVIIHHHHVPHGCVSTINPLCFWWFDFFIEPAGRCLLRYLHLASELALKSSSLVVVFNESDIHNYNILCFQRVQTLCAK